MALRILSDNKLSSNTNIFHQKKSISQKSNKNAFVSKKKSFIYNDKNDIENKTPFGHTTTNTKNNLKQKTKFSFKTPNPYKKKNGKASARKVLSNRNENFASTFNKKAKSTAKKVFGVDITNRENILKKSGKWKSQNTKNGSIARITVPVLDEENDIDYCYKPKNIFLDADTQDFIQRTEKYAQLNIVNAMMHEHKALAGFSDDIAKKDLEVPEPCIIDYSDDLSLKTEEEPFHECETCSDEEDDLF